MSAMETQDKPTAPDIYGLFIKCTREPQALTRANFIAYATANGIERGRAVEALRIIKRSKAKAATQVACGYCYLTEVCKKRSSHHNKAANCKQYSHYMKKI